MRWSARHFRAACEIGAATVRGVESQGMLCSARELGLSDDHAGLMLLDPDAPVGADLRDYLALDDRTFTIKLTPDRADCLSVVGVAREVAALISRVSALALPTLDAQRSSPMQFRIASAGDCRSFGPMRSLFGASHSRCERTGAYAALDKAAAGA